MVTALPVLPRQYRAKAAFTSWYNSRLGSYDTLRISSARAGAAARARTRAAARGRVGAMRALLRSNGLEVNLSTGQDGLLAGTVAEGGPALERGLLVVQDALDVSVQVPVEADLPRAGLSHRLRDVRETQGDGLVTHLELVHPRHQLERAPPEIGNEIDLEALGRGAHDQHARAAQEKGVRPELSLVPQVEAAVAPAIAADA